MTAVLLSADITAVQADDDVIRAATDATFPPMEFVKDGERTGFDVDLVNALADAMGKKVKWIDTDFKGLIPGVIARRFDIAVSAIYITEERAKVVDFTKPYYAGGLVAVTNDDSVQKLSDLDGKTVSVQVGTKSVSYLKNNYPQVNLTEVEKNQQMFNLVEIGRTAAAVTGKPAAKLYAQSRGDMRVLEEQLTTESYGIAVRKDLPELTESLNAALETLKQNGTYDTLVTKWFESSTN
jgi:polar amino acid transport system substrate-binding protein